MSQWIAVLDRVMIKLFVCLCPARRWSAIIPHTDPSVFVDLVLPHIWARIWFWNIELSNILLGSMKGSHHGTIISSTTMQCHFPLAIKLLIHWPPISFWLKHAGTPNRFPWHLPESVLHVFLWCTHLLIYIYIFDLIYMIEKNLVSHSWVLTLNISTPELFCFLAFQPFVSWWLLYIGKRHQAETFKST